MAYRDDSYHAITSARFEMRRFSISVKSLRTPSRFLSEKQPSTRIGAKFLHRRGWRAWRRIGMMATTPPRPPAVQQQ